MKLEEEIKTLTANLKAAEDLSATRYQRCEELQASAEKYHTLKIGTRVDIAGYIMKCNLLLMQFPNQSLKRG